MKDIRHSLEGNKLFPIFAWGVLFFFVLALYGMVVELREATENLRVSTERLQQQVNTDPKHIDLEAY